MKHQSYRAIKWMLVAALVVVAGFCHSCSRNNDTVSLKGNAAKEVVSESVNPGLPSPEPAKEESGGSAEAVGMDAAGTEAAGTEAVCYVHICGAVASPGVYEMEEGQRIYQVVERAGGYTQDAAVDYLNLAEPVADGMKLIVPTKEELLAEPAGSLHGTATSQEAAAQPARINLNTATKEQLMELSGIGEARAGDIIRYREEQGGFQRIEDIMNIPGIKNAAFEKIKDRVTV